MLENVGTIGGGMNDAHGIFDRVFKLRPELFEEAIIH